MGARLVRAAVAAVFLYLGLALVAWWADGTARAGESVVLKQIDELMVPAPTPTPDLMRALMAWAAPRLGLPVPAVVPRVIFKDRCEIEAIATGKAVPPACDPAADGIQAAHHANVIWLRDDWRADDLNDVSTLLHELVHFMQFHAGVPETPCKAEAIEKPAYAVQFAFLEAAGIDPYATVGINGLMLVMVTSCLGRS